MCGVIDQSSGFERLKGKFSFKGNLPPGPVPAPRRFPKQDIFAITQFNGTPELSSMKWGLIPSWWSKDKLPDRTWNARAETVEKLASYRNAFRSRRCLIPVMGFYEYPDKHYKWPDGRIKGYHCRYARQDNEPFALAGLWDSWDRNPGRQIINSCSIVTTTPMGIVSRIHQRSPVILKEEDYDAWLNPQNRDVNALKKLLMPYASEEFLEEVFQG